jgi:hypothetical protein
VLRSLQEAPYEPIASADLKYLTFKTLFLIWLAAGARRGEIHALDTKKVLQYENWQKVTIGPNPKFLPKNHKYQSGRKRFQGFTIEGLKHRVGPDLQKDYSLCPVRALRFYLDRTKDVRKDTTQLFISLQNRVNRAVGKNTIASWVKQTILHAYRHCSEEEIRNLKVSSHEVRALAMSTAFYGNTSIDDIISAGRWANQTTFTSFYLRDMSTDLEGIFHLGPVVVGQQVLPHSS